MNVSKIIADEVIGTVRQYGRLQSALDACIGSETYADIAGAAQDIASRAGVSKDERKAAHKSLVSQVRATCKKLDCAQYVTLVKDKTTGAYSVVLKDWPVPAPKDEAAQVLAYVKAHKSDAAFKAALAAALTA